MMSFQEKGDSKLEYAGAINALQFSVGYAPFQNVGFNASYNSYSHRNFISEGDDSLYQGSLNQSVDLEVVYFKQFKSIPELYLEHTIGTGYSNINQHLNDNVELNSMKYFYQTTLSYQEEASKVGIASRFSLLDYNIEGTHSDVEFYSKKYDYEIYTREPIVVWEPTLMLQLGYKYCYVWGAVSYAYPLNNNNISIDRSDIHLGITIQTGRIFKDIRNKKLKKERPEL